MISFFLSYLDFDLILAFEIESNLYSNAIYRFPI